MARVPSLTTTGTGATTDWIGVGPGEYTLRVRWAGSAGSTRIQERALDSSGAWADVKAPDGTDLDITSNDSLVLPGNADYRLNVTTHTSAATLTATKFTD